MAQGRCGVHQGGSETSDEHIVLTPGRRVFSRTSRRLEPSRRHDAGFLDKVKGLPWDARALKFNGCEEEVELDRPR